MSSFGKEFNIKFLKKVIDKRYKDQPELAKIKKKLFLRQFNQFSKDSEDKKNDIKSLNSTEKERWSRQLENPILNQKKIKETKVCVFGLGGIGTNVLLNLIYSGVSDFIIIDYDKIELSNLNRQTLYTPNEIESFKTVSVKKRLKQINSESNIEIHNLEIDYPKEIELLKTDRNKYSERINLIDSIISKSDIIINAVDLKGAPYLINDLCVKNQKPFLWGAINFFLGEIYFFCPSKKTPCLREIFNSKEILNKNSFLRYKEPQHKAKFGYNLGAVAIITGSLISNLILLDINDINHHSYGHNIIYDAYNFEIRKIPINSIETCQCKKYFKKVVDK